MKKLSISLLVMTLFGIRSFAQTELYGPFVGGSVFVYKSNLYNAHDLAADSVQKYAFTPGFGASFEFGHRYQNGFSVTSGLSFGTSNQTYKTDDTIYGDVLKFNAKTTMAFIKIPLILSMQTRSDKAAKAFYSLGAFYSYNTGFSDKITYDFKYGNDYTTTITKQQIETVRDKDTNKYVSNLAERPYRRHGWGAILALGASKRFNKNTEWFFQTKIEYQISSTENNDEMVFTPAAGSKTVKKVDHVWGNYAKYLFSTNRDFNRPATHPFNLGLSFGIRYYLYDFE